MRAFPLTAGTVLAAALLLTSCGGGADDDGAGTGAGQDRGGDTSACASENVAVEIGPANAAPVAGDTGNIPVTLTNQGAGCTLKGFPAVGLAAGDTSVTVPSDEAARAQPLTLAKDTAASFTITYVRGEAGGADAIDAKSVTIGLPGASESESFDWTYGPVALTGEDTPDASVSPFQQAGD
ncbi:hypothetical protein ADL00_03330 [Streptomyces sp. AS58]|uniref:DUF4232 domain-containing protein n=1 Tax=Streptomyces cadmiisoli TaxID=2184053 RepID=A0A2Z4IZX4_9ACTN|nr:MULTISPECIES: DUF4232 domain-containing protein [Streptomyces]AWW38369.1 DUF4232 domain-containing protein [Streptomyces cadmiisoli]KOV73658.1 hypothetical protein ADL00_03330 [Streptomyces sp. AS58]